MDEFLSESAYPTPYANSPWLPLILMAVSVQKYTPIVKTQFRPEYDYIVVGAGSAGCVVAARLSEIPCVSVLLLEAGKVPPKLTEVPILSCSWVDTDVDWKYFTVPQRHAGKGYINRQLPIPRGKMLGGCSTHNGMQFTIGNRRDYDAWDRNGTLGWRYKDVKPYFKKLEDNLNHEYVANGYHGVGGPMTISRQRYQPPLQKALFEALNERGYNKTDPNGPCQTGAYEVQTNTRDGQRCSTAKAYLVPAENRTNLDIVPNVFVTKVSIQNKSAKGVCFVFKGAKHCVGANKEVILSGGTFGSAQLLLLSGVGPAEHLTEMGIKVEADLPVGLNFHDHCGIPMMFALSDDIRPLSEKIQQQRSMLQFINHKTGTVSCEMPLCYNGVEMIAYMKDIKSTLPRDYPDLQIAFNDMSVANLKKKLPFLPEVYEKMFAPYENRTVYACWPLATHPKSRGTVTLKSKFAYDHPNIDPNFLADESDLDHLVEGMKSCLDIGSSEPMKRLGSEPFATLNPACEELVADRDSYLRCHARSLGTSSYHPVGTAKMGDPSDPSTVVDSELRVKGIGKLRVVDASVIPIIISANINIPVIMIAEKAADMMKRSIKCYDAFVKDDWKKKPV